MRRANIRYPQSIIPVASSTFRIANLLNFNSPSLNSFIIGWLLKSYKKIFENSLIIQVFLVKILEKDILKRFSYNFLK